LPNALVPTETQRRRIHVKWINTIPFPRMRENLIQWEQHFDHLDFARDGDDTLDDEVTTGRKGLILWGEPHRVENWEVTPGFLRKWMWTMEGCNELIESTNRWRRVRGEEPIRIQR
ncbi:hypothetical protein ASPSYDRAFT_126258, partial [Aspergillus sydowii CBS 593.65]